MQVKLCTTLTYRHSHALQLTHKRTHTHTHILLALSFTSCDAKLTLQTVQDSVWKMPPLLHSLLLYYFHVKWTITEAVVYFSPSNPNWWLYSKRLVSTLYLSILMKLWSFTHCSFTQLPLFQFSLCFQMWKWKEHTWREERIKDTTWDDTIFRFKSAMDKGFVLNVVIQAKFGNRNEEHLLCTQPIKKLLCHSLFVTITIFF